MRLKLLYIWRLLFAKSWAVVIVGKENTFYALKMHANEAIDAMQAIGEGAEKLVEQQEQLAAGSQGEENVNAAIRIANGH